MSRLTIEQIRAPDLSGISSALTNANRSFNDGMDAATKTLSLYQSGQQNTADSALIKDIASIKSEEELNNYLHSDALLGKNFSPAMQKTILGLRSNLIANQRAKADIGGVNARTDGTYANSAATRSATAINQAVEGRTANEYNYKTGVRSKRDALTPYILAANAEGNRYGIGGRPGVPVQNATKNTRLMLARTLQAEAGNEGYQGMIAVGSVINNRASSGKYGKGIEGVIIKPGQFSAWNKVTGYANGQQGQDMNFQPSDEAFKAADAILSGQYRDNTGGATHYYNPNISQPDWAKNKQFNRIGNHMFGNVNSNNNIPITQNNPNTPANDALRKVLSDLPPDIALKYLDRARQDQQTGQADINKMETQRSNEAINQGILDAAKNPDNITSANVISDFVKSNPNNLTATQQIKGAARAGNIASTTLKPVVSPAIQVNPMVNAVINSQIDSYNREFQALPQTRILERSNRMKANPAKVLTEELGIGKDGENPSSWFFDTFGERPDPIILERYINDIATKTHISPSMAAAAMAEVFRRDPFGTNSVGNRFNSEEVVKYVNTHLNKDAMKRYDGIKLSYINKKKNYEAASLQIANLKTRIAKMGPSPERQILANRVDRLEKDILSKQ